MAPAVCTSRVPAASRITGYRGTASESAQVPARVEVEEVAAGPIQPSQASLSKCPGRHNTYYQLVTRTVRLNDTNRLRSYLVNRPRLDRDDHHM